MRYARKRFEALESARFCVGSDPETLDTAVDRLVGMHHDRWKGRAESHAFSSVRDVAFHQELMRACIVAGTLRLYCLEVQDRIIAMCYCYRHRQGIYHFQSGFDPRYATYSPGSVLLGLLLEDAIREATSSSTCLEVNPNTRPDGGPERARRIA
jgi:CelD/BcsL family acetyltransferase involved in cellulose biosynthesis